MNTIVIDVREKDEFKREHVIGAINIPLSSFELDAPAILERLNDQKILVMCLSGKRASIAFDKIKKMPTLNESNYEIYQDGIKGWKHEGKLVTFSGKQSLPIMRQVQICAGSLILLAAVLATTVNPNFWFFTAAIGAGLVFAGVTGICGLVEIFKLLPWNKC
jgi:rhodanese-related sulfurtransferase